MRPHFAELLFNIQAKRRLDHSVEIVCGSRRIREFSHGVRNATTLLPARLNASCFSLSSCRAIRCPEKRSRGPSSLRLAYPLSYTCSVPPIFSALVILQVECCFAVRKEDTLKQGTGTIDDSMGLIEGAAAHVAILRGRFGADGAGERQERDDLRAGGACCGGHNACCQSFEEVEALNDRSAKHVPGNLYCRQSS